MNNIKLACLILIGTLMSTMAQVWGIKPSMPIIAINIAAIFCLFVLCNRLTCILFIIIDVIFCITSISVQSAIGSPLTLTSIINGSRFVNILGLSIFSYIQIDKSLFFVACGLLQIYIISHGKYKFKRNSFISISSVTILLIFLSLSFISEPLSSFYPEQNYNRQNISSTPPEYRSLHARGYFSTFILELITKYPWRVTDLHLQSTEKKRIEHLPILMHTNKIVFIQIESLDYEVLTTKIDNEYVMPYLQQLSNQSVLLRLDGTKKLASANSDYEIFTGRIASSAFLHYEYKNDFSTSLLTLISKKIPRTYSFHGMPHNYMNQGAAYHKQGIRNVYELESMKSEGVFIHKDIWDGVVCDSDLFDFAIKKIPKTGSFFHFIITLDMHMIDCPEKIRGIKQIFHDTAISKNRLNFYNLCRNTDIALKQYIERLPNNTTVAIWGDHSSYTNEASGYIPFILFVTGNPYVFKDKNTSHLIRSDMYNYLYKNLSNIIPQNNISKK